MKSLLVVASLLILGGLGLIFLPTPGAPALACEPHQSSASPLVKSADTCAVTPQSALAYQEWDAEPKWDNLVGLAILLVGVGLGGTVLARHRRARGVAESTPRRSSQPADSDIGP